MTDDELTAALTAAGEADYTRHGAGSEAAARAALTNPIPAEPEKD